MKENFAIVNFSGESFEASVLKVDFAEKKIGLMESFKFSDANLIRVLKRFFSFVFYPRPYKVILVFSPRDAAGYYDAVSLARDDGKGKITEEELADLVSRAVWEFFDASRAKALKQLNSGEAEILLSDISVYDFKLDGRRVINPFKESARRVEFNLGQTFVKRMFLKKILRLLPKRAEKVFVLEGGAAASHLLRRFSKNGKFIFARTSRGKTDTFSADKEKINFSDYFDWGEADIYKGVSGKLRIGVAEAESVVGKFLTGQTSPYFAKKFGSVFSDEIITLFQGLKSAPGVVPASAVYLDFPLLKEFIKKGLKFKKISTKMIMPVSPEDTFDKFGFELKGRPPGAESPDFLTASVLLETYFSPTPSHPLSLINRLAKRRMRWLMPA